MPRRVSGALLFVYLVLTGLAESSGRPQLLVSSLDRGASPSYKPGCTEFPSTAFLDRFSAF
jgi:hypothetical protein